ncbi:protein DETOXIFICATION 29-like isoform X2 [Cornus florida]|uniref:protein DETOXIFICATION 29-like isoform X2 n=1 Tax=Cornus florida TaxID=4283 RepID=UPI0028991737|nr:protein DETOXIFICATION 29-like isoform X2 [Cornus florida]
MENNEQPLLSTIRENDHGLTSSSSSYDVNDIGPINGVRDIFREFAVESKKLWWLAAPAILTSLFQYSMAAITQVFAGHLGTIDLAALSVENSVIAAFGYGIMWGLGSALESLCGIAFGAGQIEMLGTYMQRSWVILNTAALGLMFLYIFATQFLKLMGQTAAISEAAGTFALWMIPQLFAYAMNFPLMKFLQAQRKFIAMAVISGVALALHTIFSWLLMLKLGWGLVGAAVVLNSSWWFIVVAQLVYALNGACGGAWTGFSLEAFQNLWGFVRLSLASAVMLCLDMWYFAIPVLLAGYLTNEEDSVDASSICTNILGWTTMAAYGFSAAISVRVSNELGATHPKTAKFTVTVVGITSFLIGIFLAAILIITRKQYPALFSTSVEVKQLLYELTPVLGACIAIASVQLSLSGVAIGAGWQALVACVYIGCYYIVGVPLSLLMGFALNMGVQGIWCGLLFGMIAQTCAMLWIMYSTNWNKEASIAGDKIIKWGGKIDADKNENEPNSLTA